MTLALGEAPERVATISVSVRDLEENLLATSATIAAPKTSVSLGVPAERPLELLAIARTNRPGPAAIGSMPAYLGRAERTIALGREQELVSMTVHPAGVLTVFSELEDDGEGLLGYRLEPEDNNERAVELADPEDQRHLILRTGRYDAVVVQDLDDAPFERELTPNRGIYVAAEIESLARFHFRKKAPRLEPNDPVLLELDTGGPVITEPGMEEDVELSIDAKNAAGESVVVPEAIVRVRISAEPFTALNDPPSIEVTGLPARISGISFSGLGRAIIRATAELADERTIRGAEALNILPRNVSAGLVEEVLLSIEDPSALEEGTVLEVSLLDARGLFATEQEGMLDLSASDPWAFFPAGPTTALSPEDQGLLRRELSRPSGPRGLEVIVRATLTSTAPSLTLSSSVALPLLEM
jgi:hypothetical protein